jgi:thiosulfate/3-mercaptopyruvate sulfurtransferase
MTPSLPDLPTVHEAYHQLQNNPAQWLVLDASYYLPTESKDPFALYLKAHLPNAQFFPLELVADASTGLPHMLPTAEQLTQFLRKAGYQQGQSILIYDQKGLFSSPRLWWTLKTYGLHQAAQIALLQGGLPAWQEAGLTTESGYTCKADRLEGGALSLVLEEANVATKQAVLEAVASNETKPLVSIVDARSADRFAGAVPEPRAGLRAGHIPTSINLPFSQLLTPDGSLKPADALAPLLVSVVGADKQQPVVCTCGSGITACIIALALETLGYEAVSVYDGSWAEWGADSHCPVASTV